MSEVISKEIIDKKEGNVESEFAKNKVLLTGAKALGGQAFFENLTLEVFSTVSNKKIVANIPYSGYHFKLFLGDFNNDGLDEILIRGSSGVTGGFAIAVIYAYLDGTLKEIFNQEDFNNEYKYIAKYLDYYKVLIKSENFNKNFILDISLRSRSYLDLIYDENGKLKEERSAKVTKLTGLCPIDSIYNNYYEIATTQEVCGINNTDILGEVQCVANLINSRFNITNLGIITYGEAFDVLSIYRAIDDKIHSMLPKGATVISLDKFGGKNDIIEYDFDDDGANEILVAYSLLGEPYIAIIKRVNEKLSIMDSFKGSGYNIKDLYIAPFDTKDILIGWSLGAGNNWLDLISFENGKLNLKPKNYMSVYGILYLEDINKDGIKELVLWRNDIGEAYYIKIYDFIKVNFVETSKYDEIYFKKVKAYYEKLLSENGEIPIYLYYLAEAEEKLKEYEEALKIIDKALNTKNPYPSIQFLNAMKNRILIKYKIQ